ncbi:MAG: hypothetical protein FJY88_00435 [Candidatus Eisenbacteria bacterium]|nr:hypothetical protein [Candidatus Eisenbacteria bacterium]
MAATIEIREEPPILRIRLNRPERRNAFDERMIAELTEAFVSVAAAPRTRVVSLEGEGEFFCAGADLEWMRRAAQFTRRENLDDARRLAAMFVSVASCPAPIVARIRGGALGGGMGLVAVADIAVAARDAFFGFTEVRLGIIPVVISPFVLKKLRPADAQRYFLTGERFTAEEALRVGLIASVADPEGLDAMAERLISELLSGAPTAQREAKQLLQALHPFPPDIHERTADWIARMRESDEAREGVNAFLERRRPRWSRIAGEGANE